MPQPTVLITGAARRIGKSIAMAFAARGCNLMIHYNASEKDAKRLRDELSSYSVDCLLHQADLSSTSQLERLIAAGVNHFGKLDHLVNNASVFYPTPIVQASEEQLTEIFQVNFHSPRKLAELVEPYLRATSGSIVNMLDIYAETGLAEHGFYVASKAALRELTRRQARQFAPQIRVNGVSPGAILWPDESAQNSIADDESTHQITAAQRAILEHSALKRLGDPSQIAAAVVYLALDANYATGSIIRVDGGRRDFL